jgi:transcriptional regulator with XRE-family HTH domain
MKTPLFNWRRGKKLTQSEAADIFGVTQPYVSRLERGEIQKPDLGIALVISRKTGLPLKSLIAPA